MEDLLAGEGRYQQRRAEGPSHSTSNKMSYRHQSYWNPCRRGSFSSGSYYGGSGQRICYYPQTSWGGYGRSYYPQTSWGGYGRGYYPQSSWGGYGRGYYPQTSWGGYGRSYYPQTSWGGYGRSCMSPFYSGGYGYGRGYYPQQYYGGYGYGGLYGRKYGWGSGSRRGSMCWGYGSRRGSMCYEPYGYSSGGCYPLKRRYSCSSIDGPC
ncbi:UNVERIFIED_CONTAM: hypothetical protein K2H54_024697 [Gekko kuhli]